MTINIFVIGLFQPLLLPNQLAVVEIIDAHRVADVVKRGLGLGDGNFSTFAEDFPYSREVFFQFGAALPYGLEGIVENRGEEILYHYVSEASGPVLGLDFVQALEFEA